MIRLPRPFIGKRSSAMQQTFVRRDGRSIGKIVNLSIIIDDERITHVVCAGAKAHIRVWSEGLVEGIVAAIQSGLDRGCDLGLHGDHLDLVGQLSDGRGRSRNA